MADPTDLRPPSPRSRPPSPSPPANPTRLFSAATRFELTQAPQDALEILQTSPIQPIMASQATDSQSRNPLNLIASSSPSRALSRMWDRFSPPSIPSPFHLPHPPAFPDPSRLLTRSSAPPSSASSALAPPALPGSASRDDTFARRRREHTLPSGAITPAEERELAGQLSFSLKRGGIGRQQQLEGPSSREGRLSWPRSASLSAVDWEPPSFRLPEVKIPAVLGRGRKGKEKEIVQEQEQEDATVDDEACFVDGWEGKVDFLTSLPSELALSILLHLDFRTLLACSAVSQNWRLIALDPLLWRNLFHANERWALKPEVYRAAAAAAQAAALTPAVAVPSTPLPGVSGISYFDHALPSLSLPLHRPPGMPSIKRAATSFGRAAASSSAGAKRAVAAGADRVQSGSAALGRRISEIAGDLSALHLTPSPSSPGASATSDVASEVTVRTPRPIFSRRATTAVVSNSITGTTASSLIAPATSSASLVGLPSTSTLQTNAFASPPSATASLSRHPSSTALSTLSSLPTISRHTSLRQRTSSISASTPTARRSVEETREADERAEKEGAALLNWLKLFKDKWRLERRWERGTTSWSWLEGHADSVYCVQFDEKKVVSGSRDRTIRIWDLASGTVTRTLIGHAGSVLCLQYDDQILVSGSSDSRILVWDMEPGEGQHTFKMTLVGHSMGVLDLCFDKEWIVSCSKDTTTRVWHRSTGQLYRTLSGHRGPVNAVQLHGSHVLSASGDALMKLWDIHTGQALRSFSGHTRGLACVHWAPSGRYFVSGSNDKTIKLWDADSGECLQTFTGHQDLVRSLWFDERSKRVVSASYDRSTRVWDAETGEEVQVYKSHASLVFDVAFDASRIVSCSHDQRILIMDFGAGLDVDKFA
ncbi:hypothetical protein JCM11641_003009 [Rhodosporidiobolus odoratus]